MGGGRVPEDLLVHLRRAHDEIDRHYASSLDLDRLAGLAGVSKYHFLRSFAAVYGHTPAAQLTRRRIERAQDLLRATNLTVTEVCMAVGYSSLGSFSSRFRKLVGTSPSAYQARWSERGSKKFYCDVLGFVENTDVTMGDGFRWVTVHHPRHPELEVTMMVPGPPLDDDMAEAVRRSLAAGRMGGFGLTTDDCRGDHARLEAQGVEFPQPPSDRPYGIEAVMRDNSGNWLVLVENRPYDGGEFPHA